MASKAKQSKLEVTNDHAKLEITVVDMHTGGEPLRIITSGYPEIKGETILAKRKYVGENLDSIRKLLMREPRGHSGMYGALLVTPDHEQADIAVLFMHNGGYSVMCGHAVIALGRYAVDSGLVKVDASTTSRIPVNIQCPCGLVKAVVDITNGKSGKVKFISVPAFAFAIDVKLPTKSYGEITLDIGYGGTFYALIADKELSLDIRKSSTSELMTAAKEILEICREKLTVSHPVESDLSFIYGVIITDGKDQFAEFKDEASCNMCYFGDGQVDRSPTGSGVTARIAVQYHKRQIALNQSRMFESIVGSTFTGSPIQETKCGEFPAVLVDVEEIDTGRIVGMAQAQDGVGMAQPQAQDGGTSNGTGNGLMNSIFNAIKGSLTAIGSGISALDQLTRVPGLIKDGLSNVDEEYAKYEDLRKECSSLAIQYEQFMNEIKSHIRTVKKEVQINTKIIERAKQMLEGNNIPSNCLVDVETTVKESKTRSEDLKEKYDVFIKNVSDFCSKAKAAQDRNEYKADFANKLMYVSFFGGFGGGVGIALAHRVIGVSSLVCGSVLCLPCYSIENSFRKCVDNNKVLHEQFNQIDGVLLKNSKVLTEICQLLKDLQDAVHRMSSYASARPSSDTEIPSDDDMNDFMIGLGFDSFKKASKELEMECDYILNDMSLKTPSLGLFSLDKKCDENSTDKEKLN